MGLQRVMQQDAFDVGSIDSLIYTNLRNASLAKQAEAIQIEQSLLEQRVVLLALLGGELPEIAQTGKSK